MPRLAGQTPFQPPPVPLTTPPHVQPSLNLSSSVMDSYNQTISKMLITALPSFEQAVIGCFFVGSANSTTDVRIYYRSKDSKFKLFPKSAFETINVDFDGIFIKLRDYFRQNNDDFESYTLILNNTNDFSYKAKANRVKNLTVTKAILDEWKKENLAEVNSNV